MSTPRVVITGLGVVSNIGLDVTSMWDSILACRSGIGPITAFEQDDQWSVRIAGEAHGWDPHRIVGPREAHRMDRFCLLGLDAAEQACLDSGIDFTVGDPYRRGVVIGSGVGGIITIEEGSRRLLGGGPRKLSPFTVPRLMVNACAGNVSIRHDLRGANSAPATACASGAHAIGTALDIIRRGEADVMVAGGAEAAISPLCVGSFSVMKALSSRNDEPTRASRPFDRDRDGFVLAEGAGILVLESLEHAQQRGAKIYAELCGCGTSGDAQHIAAPAEDGAGALAAMEFALKSAGIDKSQVDYINAHGTSTPLGDVAEVQAVRRLFGDDTTVAMSSTKSMTGHGLGAAGGIESVIVVKSVETGVRPATINLDHPDEGFDLNLVPNEPQEGPIRYALNNSFGFGGHNVSVVFGRFEG